MQENSEEKSQTLVRMQKVLLRLMEMMQGQSDIKEVHKALEFILQQFGGSRIYVIEYDWSLHEQNCRFEAVADGAQSQMSQIQHIPLDDTPWFTQRMCACKSILINNMELLPESAVREGVYMSEQGVNSFIMLPIFTGELVTGHWGIDMVGNHSYYWTQQDYHWLAAFSHLLSVFWMEYTNKETKKDEYVNTRRWELDRARLNSIYNNIPVGIEIYDKEGYMVDINDKDVEIFGIVHKEELIGSNLFDNPIIPPSVLEKLRNLEDINLHLDYDFKKVGGFYMTHVKNAVKSLNIKGKCILNSHGELDYYLFVVSDNTETERINAQVQDFQNLFSVIACYSKVGYAKFNLTTGKGFAAGEWYRNVGVDERVPLNQIIDSYEHLYEEDRKCLQKFYGQAIRGEATTYSGDVRVVCPGGKWKWLHKNIIVEERKNKELEMTEINFDITYAKETEENLMEAKEKAEESNKLKSAFLANMSHEIRTPLNAIVGFSNILTETESEEEKKEYFQIIENNNTLLLQLINDILDLSKIEAGTLEFNYSDVNVNGVMAEVESVCRLRLPDDRVFIVFDEHIPECVLHTDKNRITQVLMNFVTNAIKFTNFGTIRLGYHLVDKNTIRFDVSDTGTGIPEEKQKAIFDRFIKLDSQAQGTGLGLTICSTIINRLGGVIGVDSIVGEGSTFWFNLPYIQKKLVEMPTAPSEDNAVKEQVGKDRLIILIAEDDASNYKLYESILKKDYILIHAWNGKEAVELYKKHCPHLVLMDIKMPVMDGYEATKKIREISSTVPIIAATAFAFEEDENRILNSGFDGYVTKPVQVKSLKDKIVDLLKKRILII